MNDSGRAERPTCAVIPQNPGSRLTIARRFSGVTINTATIVQQISDAISQRTFGTVLSAIMHKTVDAVGPDAGHRESIARMEDLPMHRPRRPR